MIDMQVYMESPFFYICAGIATIFSLIIATLFILIQQSKRRLNSMQIQEISETSEHSVTHAGDGDKKQSDEEGEDDEELEEEEEEEEDEEEEVDIDDAIISHEEIQPCEELERPQHPATVNPVDYTEHIQGKVKQARANYITKQIEKKMTPNQITEEREAQRRQLEAIYSLMKDNETKFGLNTMDEVDEQFKLYA